MAAIAPLIPTIAVQMAVSLFQMASFPFQMAAFLFQMASFPFQMAAFLFQMASFRLQIATFPFQMAAFLFQMASFRLQRLNDGDGDAMCSHLSSQIAWKNDMLAPLFYVFI